MKVVIKRNNLINKINIFINEIKKYQKSLNLLDWRIEVDQTFDNGIRGKCEWDLPGRCATIFYNKEFIKRATTDQIDTLALHECLELLMADINDSLGSIYNRNFIEPKIHRIIRILEKMLIIN